MTAELAIVQPTAQGTDLSAIERVIVAGDLSKLTAEQRWDYYRGVCSSVGLNPFTKPFEYITLNGKLTLYALKGAADQLRAKHGISITQPKVELTDGMCMVTVTASDRTGRTDSELGIVPCDNLRGDAKANAILKAITKAKRRVTLSMCGLGMLDETEVETVPSARPASIATLPADEPAVEVPQAPPFDRPAYEQAFRAGTAEAIRIGIDVEEIDPTTLSDEALKETFRALKALVKETKALLEQQAAQEPAEDDSDAPF